MRRHAGSTRKAELPGLHIHPRRRDTCAHLQQQLVRAAACATNYPPIEASRLLASWLGPAGTGVLLRASGAEVEEAASAQLRCRRVLAAGQKRVKYLAGTHTVLYPSAPWHSAVARRIGSATTALAWKQCRNTSCLQRHKDVCQKVESVLFGRLLTGKLCTAQRTAPDTELAAAVSRSPAAQLACACQSVDATRKTAAPLLLHNYGHRACSPNFSSSPVPFIV